MTRKSLLLAVVLPLCLAPRAVAEINLWGYAGIAGPDTNWIGSVESSGITTNVASVDFPEGWTSTNLASITSEFQAAGVKSALFLDNVLFKQFYVTSSNCVDSDGIAPDGPFVWGLRGNWQSRLANFFNTNGSYINTATTSFLIINGEVNNRCMNLDQVGTAATAVRSYFPSLPLVLGYGRSPGAQPAPAFIPASIDWVGFFKYGTFDPANPAHPYNADNQYLVELNDLKTKLAMHQRIILVPDGFWATFLHKNLNSHLGPGMGWPKWYLSSLALNYEAFAQADPLIEGMLVFLWPSPSYPTFQGTADLPPSVRDAHRDIGCRRLGC